MKSIPKVLAVIGYTRSGSTVLDNMLGELTGFFSAGELHSLWERGVLEGRLCGCGRTVRQCEVWSEVLGRVFADARTGPEQIIGWRKQALRTRHTWKLLRHVPSRGQPGSAAMGAYVRVVAALYHAITTVTGARVIVDSSKRPSDAALLRFLPGLEPFFVHLVRDPRAVAYSWQRHKRELDGGRAEEMPRRGPIRSAAEWAAVNLAAEAVRRREPSRSVLLKYEDLVAEPRKALERIVRLLGEVHVELPFLDDHTVSLSPNHTVSGNPSRFATGAVRVHADDEWKLRMGRRERVVATAVAWPLLRRYRYSAAPWGASEAAAQTGDWGWQR
jgi:Sulfotransferase family